VLVLFLGCLFFVFFVLVGVWWGFLFVQFSVFVGCGRYARVVSFPAHPPLSLSTKLFLSYGRSVGFPTLFVYGLVTSFQTFCSSFTPPSRGVSVLSLQKDDLPAPFVRNILIVCLGSPLWAAFPSGVFQVFTLVRVTALFPPAVFLNRPFVSIFHAYRDSHTVAFGGVFVGDPITIIISPDMHD